MKCGSFVECDGVETGRHASAGTFSGFPVAAPEAARRSLKELRNKHRGCGRQHGEPSGLGDMLCTGLRREPQHAAGSQDGDWARNGHPLELSQG
jgi:hypothetical protein